MLGPYGVPIFIALPSLLALAHVEGEALVPFGLCYFIVPGTIQVHSLHER